LSQYQGILGHERSIEQLERARVSERVAHAYLFHGPDGVGKQRVAFAFAQALNCEQPGQGPCQECESCRKISRLTHPDVRLLASEASLVERELMEMPKGSPSSQIKNAQLDELAGLFRHRPYLGRTKVVVVDEADRMNINSQNRFLKTLEEPSADSVIILVSAHPNVLLPTIRSRCQALSFGPLPRDRVAGHLCEHFDLTLERAQVLAAMAQGSLGRAEALADETLLDERDQVREELARIMTGDVAEVLAAGDGIGAGRAGRDRLEGTLDLLELWIRDLLLCSLAVDEGLLVNQDRRDELARSGQTAEPRRLLGWLDRIRGVRGSLRANANPKMAFEALLIGMRSD
jgi:DNA polymerase-3 subunit delta'